MYTVTITRDVLTFDELRERGGKAFDRACEYVRDIATPDSFILSDYLSEELRDIAGDDAELTEYAVNYSQGDGVNIRADIRLADAPTPSVGPKLPALDGVERLRVSPWSPRHLGSACHVDITWTDTQAEAIESMSYADECATTARVEDAVGEWYRATCAHLYAYACADIEYWWDVDNVAEFATDNAMEFYSDGSPL